MRCTLYLTLLCTYVVCDGAYAEREISLSGQIRPRYEFRNPLRDGTEATAAFTSMRVRAQLDAALAGDVDAMIQLQDVRFFGEEQNTLADYSADNFDVHQAYIHFKQLGGSRHALKIGRQAVALGGQRLIGAVEWTQQGRVFDGLRLSLAPSWGKVDVVAIQLAEASSAQFSHDAYLAGIYATLGGVKKGGRPQGDAPTGDLDMFGLYDKEAGASTTDRVTLGLRLAGQRAAYAYRVEGSYQTGTRRGEDVAAFMFGGRVGRPFGRLKLDLWYDYLSGDSDPYDGETKVFDTLFATNHKFYGFADRFLNIPVHTNGLGLQDFALKGAVPLGTRTSLAVHGHSFFTAAKGEHLCEEVDLTLTYQYRPNVAVVGGLSQVVSDDAMAAVNGLKGNMTFAFLLTNATF